MPFSMRLVMTLTVFLGCMGVVGADPPVPVKTQNIIFVMTDGLRWQEVFRGADSVLLCGDQKLVGGDGSAARRKYWRPTVGERRAALMPFLWSAGARQGQLFGNRD